MDWMLVFAVFLFLACAALIVAEVFVPSGGLISACAVLCLVGGLIIFFQHSAAAGCIGIGVAVIMIPTVLIFSYRLLPKTKFGRSQPLLTTSSWMCDLRSLSGGRFFAVCPISGTDTRSVWISLTDSLRRCLPEDRKGPVTTTQRPI